VLAALALLLLLGAFVGVALGPAKLELKRMLLALTAQGDSAARVLVWDLRVPRVAAALVAGACLGVAGALLQSSTRNPLGDPQLFGLGGGAAIIQALAMAGGVRTGVFGLASLSVAASLVGAAVISFFASRQETSPARLALIGISVAVLASAVTTGILAEARVFSQQSLAFLGGSLTNRGWQDALSSAPYLALGLLMAVPVVGRLNLLALGDRVAANLGGDPGRTRILAMASAGILGGAAVAVAGLIGFVGLLVPHLARLLVGHDFRAVFIISAPLGAVVTLYADQAARLALMPSEVPVGMVTSLIGAPLMIYVARRVLWT
jgi:iron complex transport system permease protein